MYQQSLIVDKKAYNIIALTKTQLLKLVNSSIKPKSKSKKREFIETSAPLDILKEYKEQKYFFIKVVD